MVDPAKVVISALARSKAFYAALAAGGRDSGAPEVRAPYLPHCCGAFVWDSDGRNIQAVCRAAP